MTTTDQARTSRSAPRSNHVTNWGKDVVSFPQAVVHAERVEDIIAVMRDREHYPSPVRAVGSNHSTTHCGVADEGTLIDMRGMDRILHVGDDYVVVEAGALYIDVAKELERHGLQFFVNVELGNLSIGSAACGGTKDASMPGEFGQVASYATAMKIVTPSGEIVEVTEDDPELLQVARSSYGLFGVVYEVTFRVQQLRPMAVHHDTYSLDEFERALPELRNRGEAMMMYISPHLDTITVEFRRYRDVPLKRPSHWQWRLRNIVWSTLAPTYGRFVSSFIPFRRPRYFFVDRLGQAINFVLRNVMRSDNTVATDQLIRYGATGGYSAYTFSIWAFREDEYVDILREYFRWVGDYYQRTGYRCDLLHVGYRIAYDTSSLFSYTSEHTVMTIDPVSTGNPGWDQFLVSYNEFCSQRGGVPLFNQTKWLTREQVERAFGDRVETFRAYRRRFDPDDRMLNDYFRNVLA
ncbi:MAG: FAD-binding protein [Dehalococcoidia bacterium]|nr:FAD-binding protein [Dehalococcoidia bacterium]